MTIQTPRRENMIALLLFMVVMMLKIGAIVALCSRHHDHVGSHHDDAHPHHILKKHHKILSQTNGQKYVT